MYCGSKGDPSHFQFVLTSIMNGSYSLDEAEWAVSKSKEARAYSLKQQAKRDKEDMERLKLITLFVDELYRVYRKIGFSTPKLNSNNTENPFQPPIAPPSSKDSEEREEYIKSLFIKAVSYDQVETEFKLSSLRVPNFKK